MWVELYLDGVRGRIAFSGASLFPELLEKDQVTQENSIQQWTWWMMEPSSGLAAFFSTWRDVLRLISFLERIVLLNFSFGRMGMKWQASTKFLYWECCKAKVKEGSSIDSENRVGLISRISSSHGLELILVEYMSCFQTSLSKSCIQT